MFSLSDLSTWWLCKIDLKTKKAVKRVGANNIEPKLAKVSVIIHVNFIQSLHKGINSVTGSF